MTARRLSWMMAMLVALELGVTAPAAAHPFEPGCLLNAEQPIHIHEVCDP